MAALKIEREQAVRYRLQTNNLSSRLSVGRVLEAARFGLQDSAPRDALIGLHARMADTRPDDWTHPELIQTYAPRGAVYVLPRPDFGVFTQGCLPYDPARRAALEADADDICRELGGQELKGSAVVGRRRSACWTGRIGLRWTTSAIFVREVPRPDIDFQTARRELCLLHLHGFAPATPGSYAWWTQSSRRDAARTWSTIGDRLIELDYQGRQAWALAEDEEALREPPRPTGVRLLVPSDLRLFGQDRLGLFIGPGLRPLSQLHDTFHPGGVLADGRIIGVWGRHGGTVDIRIDHTVAESIIEAVEAEALAMPIPGAGMSVTISRS